MCIYILPILYFLSLSKLSYFSGGVGEREASFFYYGTARKNIFSEAFVLHFCCKKKC